MSSHRRRVKHFGRKPKHRRAMIRNLIVSLVENGRIKTTIDKAKELRRHVERMVTIGKNDSQATYRLLLSRIPNQKTVSALIKEVSPRFKTRPGGYTRIIKIGPRPGDQAEMAFIEFVDFDFNQAAAAKAAASGTKATDDKASKTKKAAKSEVNEAAKAKSAAAKKAAKTLAAKRKTLRKIQSRSRVINRD